MVYPVDSIAWRPSDSEEAYRDVTESLESGRLEVIRKDPKGEPLYHINLRFEDADHRGEWQDRRVNDDSLDLKIKLRRLQNSVELRAQFRNLDLGLPGKLSADMRSSMTSAYNYPGDDFPSELE